MRPETAEWVVKAEGDFHTACRELRVTEHPNFDAACYHAQQCAEKYLKAYLVEAGQVVPRVHDLEALLNLLLPVVPSWETLREALQRLTTMAVEVRYPGFSADIEDATEAVQTAERVRQIVLAKIGP